MVVGSAYIFMMLGGALSHGLSCHNRNKALNRWWSFLGSPSVLAVIVDLSCSLLLEAFLIMEAGC